MIRPPKEKFINSPNKIEWEKVTNLPAFEDAMYAALSQFISELPEIPDVSRGWDNGMQIAGVKKFIRILSTLHVTEEPEKRMQFRNLQPPK